jgi:hypothetical protein
MPVRRAPIAQDRQCRREQASTRRFPRLDMQVVGRSGTFNPVVAHLHLDAGLDLRHDVKSEPGRRPLIAGAIDTGP